MAPPTSTGVFAGMMVGGTPRVTNRLDQSDGAGVPAEPRAPVLTLTVAVMACDDEVIPPQARIEAAADDADLEEVCHTERHLLYVACTRARDHPLVTSVAPASEFFDDLRL